MGRVSVPWLLSWGSFLAQQNRGETRGGLQAQNIVDVSLFGSPRACSFGVSKTFLDRP